MLRGIFMPGGVSAEQDAYYVDLLKKERETPDWKSFLETGAFNQTTLSGKEYEDWVAREEARHILLMREAGFLARGSPAARGGDLLARADDRRLSRARRGVRWRMRSRVRLHRSRRWRSASPQSYSSSVPWSYSTAFV